MHLAITTDIKRLIDQRMKTGKYATAQDVVTAALHSLDQDEKAGEFDRDEWNQLLAKGEDGGAPLDGEKVFAELRGRG